MISVLLVVFFVSALIFVHELGHFLAAKWAGVEVHKFYLGFDIPLHWGDREFSGSLLRFRWGETQYGIGWLPFGGYVKMLGQDDADPGAPPTSSVRDFRNRPAAKRLVILLGGVAMNAIFAFIFTILAFWLGINFQVPVIGGVVPGDAAWLEGLNSGDRVEKIFNSQPDEFFDLRQDIVTSKPGQRVPLVVRRGDELITVDVLPRYDAESGSRGIGIQGTASSSVEIEPGSTAAAAGLLTGDELLGWRPGAAASGGEFAPFDPNHGDAIFAHMQFHAGQPITVEVEREGQRRQIEVQIGKSSRALYQIGTVSESARAGLQVVGVRGRLAGAPVAGGRFVAGDRVERVGGEAVSTGGQVLEALAGAAAWPLLPWIPRGDDPTDPIEVTVVPWWDSYAPDDYAAILAGCPAALSPRYSETEARRRYYGECLDKLAAAGGAPGLVATAFAMRPLGDDQVMAMDLLLERARLGSDAASNPEFLIKAGAAEQRRQARLTPPSGDGNDRFRAVIEFDADARRDLHERWPGGMVEQLVVFGGEPALSGEAQRLRAAGAPIIVETRAGSPAALAGLPVPFLLVKVSLAAGARDIRSTEELVKAVAAAGKNPIELTGYPISRTGAAAAPITVRLEPAIAGSLGIVPRFKIERVTEVGLGALRKGFDRTLRQFRAMIETVRALFSGAVSPSNVGGPILIAEVTYRVSQDYGLGRLLYLIAFISVNLAIINLFPIPPFDGGHVVLVLYEVLRGKPPTIGMLNWFGRIGLLVFLALVILVFWNDISRLVMRNG